MDCVLKTTNLRITDKLFACYKPRIYELQIGELQDKNHEFTNWEVDKLRAIA